MLHGRLAHPQTQGKWERFHRTLKAEVLNHRTFDALGGCQEAFDRFRVRYNWERLHEALAMRVLVCVYQRSGRCFRVVLLAVGYSGEYSVRWVQVGGEFILGVGCWRCRGRFAVRW